MKTLKHASVMVMLVSFAAVVGCAPAAFPGSTSTTYYVAPETLHDAVMETIINEGWTPTQSNVNEGFISAEFQIIRRNMLGLVTQTDTLKFTAVMTRAGENATNLAMQGSNDRNARSLSQSITDSLIARGWTSR